MNSPLWSRSLAVAMAIVTTVIAVPARSAAQSPDLAIVHPNAVGFVHVRLAEIWKNEAMANARMIIEKAGPKALAALDEQFVPKPSTAERVTAVLLSANPNSSEPEIIVALRFSEAFDKAKVLKAMMSGAAPKTSGGKEYFAEEQGPGGVYFPDDRTLAFATGETLESYFAWAPKADGGLSPALKIAAEGSSPVVVAVNVAALPLPPDIAEQLPPDFRPLTRTRLAIMTMDLAEKATVTVKAVYDDADAATAAEGALKQAAQMGRGALAFPRGEAEKLLYGKAPKEPGTRPVEELGEAMGAVAALGAIAYADELLADLPMKRDGSSLVASVTLPAFMTQYLSMSAVSAGLMLPAVQKAREAADRAKSMNNLKQIGLAMHNYHDTFNHFPPPAITDKNGKKLLSWRVAILPYVEQDALYRQFKLDEPWDSEHNLKLAKRITPLPYIDPRVKAEPGMTYYKVFVGKETPFPPDGKGSSFVNITDGTSNTLMVVAGGDPVFWTKPDDIPFDPEKPLPDLSKPFRQVLAAFCDGSVRALDLQKLDETKLKALITASGGEVVNFNE